MGPSGAGREPLRGYPELSLTIVALQVAVLGAAGGIGQPLSLLLKMNPLVSQLALYDIANTPGVAADLSHCNTPAQVRARWARHPQLARQNGTRQVDLAGPGRSTCRTAAQLSSHHLSPVTAQVTGYAGADQLAAALKDCDLVVIPAGVPRKPGMTRDDLFNINAGIVKGLCEVRWRRGYPAAWLCTRGGTLTTDTPRRPPPLPHQAIAVHCPKAIVNIISNPVNSTVPIAAEVFKKAGTYDAAKLFGVTTLDVVRANTFVSASKGTDLAATAVPVVGGHAGITILPLLSQAEPSGLSFTPDELEKLTVRIQNAGTEVVEAKAGAGSATLSMAYAAARFAESCLRGLAGEADVVECAFVASKVEPSLPFFSSKVRMGRNGAAEVYPVGPMTEYEKGWYAKMLPELDASIKKGIEFVNSPPAPKAA